MWLRISASRVWSNTMDNTLSAPNVFSTLMGYRTVQRRRSTCPTSHLRPNYFLWISGRKHCAICSWCSIHTKLSKWRTGYIIDDWRPKYQAYKITRRSCPDGFWVQARSKFVNRISRPGCLIFNLQACFKLTRISERTKHELLRKQRLEWTIFCWL